VMLSLEAERGELHSEEHARDTGKSPHPVKNGVHPREGNAHPGWRNRADERRSFDAVAHPRTGSQRLRRTGGPRQQRSRTDPQLVQ
jgi:hypothetical protein